MKKSRAIISSLAQDHEITELLHKWREGDRDSQTQLFERLLPDLRRIAASYFRRERAHHTLQPTAVVNEAFMRMASGATVAWKDRGHFLAISARVMRRYLIDYARSRPDAQIVSLESIANGAAAGRTSTQLATEMDSLLDELEARSPQQCKVVELKFYLGLTDEEAAESLQLSLHTLQREWYRARRWLFERLTATR